MKDPGLRACSPEARGVWIDMLCIMFECTPRGFFTTNGMAPTAEEASRMLGLERDIFLKIEVELTKNKVLSRNNHGVIFNRRMVKDQGLREQWKERKRKHRENVTEPSRKGHGLSSSSSSNQKICVSPKNGETPLAGKLKNSKPPTDPRIKEVIDFFFTTCEEVLGFKPDIAGGKDGKNVKAALKDIDLPEMKECIRFFFTIKKSDEHPTLSAAVSSHTRNLFRADKAKAESRQGDYVPASEIKAVQKKRKEIEAANAVKKKANL